MSYNQAEYFLQQDREYQQAYIDSLIRIPTITSSCFEILTNNRLCIIYPDLKPLLAKSVGIKLYLYYEKVDYDRYVYRCAEKFVDEKREKFIEFFWNIDLGKIFCLSVSDITALSFLYTKTIKYTKFPKVIEPIFNTQILQLFNSQILQLLYSKRITIQNTSRSFTSISYFLINSFTQPYNNNRTKEKIFSMISRRVKSKFLLTNKLPLIGQQYLSKGSKFDESNFCGLIRYRIENHYINFMPFLQAISSNRIYIMMFNDFKWFSQIIQTIQTTQTTQKISKLEKTGKLLDPQLAELIESVKSILFCESKDLCFKFSIFFVVYYANSLLLEKNQGYVSDLLPYIFKDNPEIPAIIHYIMTEVKLKSLILLEEKQDYYQIFEAYGKKFCDIAGCLEDFYRGNLDLPISQLFDEERSVMLNSASPLQQIVSYILNN